MEREKQIFDEAYKSGYRGKEADIFAEGAQWADENPHWFSIEDELPAFGEEIITKGIITLYDPDGIKTKETEFMRRYLQIYNGDFAMNMTLDEDDGYVAIVKATHWMKSPK